MFVPFSFGEKIVLLFVQWANKNRAHINSFEVNKCELCGSNDLRSELIDRICE